MAAKFQRMVFLNSPSLASGSASGVTCCRDLMRRRHRLPRPSCAGATGCRDPHAQRSPPSHQTLALPRAFTTRLFIWSHSHSDVKESTWTCAIFLPGFLVNCVTIFHLLSSPAPQAASKALATSGNLFLNSLAIWNSTVRAPQLLPA